MKLRDFWPNAGMPGASFSGRPPELTSSELELREALRRHVSVLASDIGERNLRRPEALAAATGYVERELEAAGYASRRLGYAVQGQTCFNVEAELRGSARDGEILVVGAHYDSVAGCPGANDNATGVAALLEIARRAARAHPARTVRFVAFVNEEPPYFQSEAMGSLVYARGCRERGENVFGMLSLETIGCYSDAPGSQTYPFPFSVFYPRTGNFVAFVGNPESRQLTFDVIESFRRHARIGSEGGVLDAAIPGVAWSDHWSFWQMGYPAVEVTDTAPYRYRFYHTPEDTPDKVDYDGLTRVVAGLSAAVADLAER